MTKLNHISLNNKNFIAGRFFVSLLQAACAKKNLLVSQIKIHFPFHILSGFINFNGLVEQMGASSIHKINIFFFSILLFWLAVSLSQKSHEIQKICISVLPMLLLLGVQAKKKIINLLIFVEAMYGKTDEGALISQLAASLNMVVREYYLFNISFFVFVFILLKIAVKLKKLPDFKILNFKKTTVLEGYYWIKSFWEKW